eukprot:1494600-Pyramimonas_sp.AAC.1
MERKHRVVKRLSAPRHNTESFDRGMMYEITVQAIVDLEHAEFYGQDLIGPRAASTQLVNSICSMWPGAVGSDITVASTRRVHSKAIVMGDCVAFHGGTAIHFGAVVFHAKIHGRLLTPIVVWDTVEFNKSHAKCTMRSEPQLINAGLIIEPCVFSLAAPGVVSHILFGEKLRISASIA